MNISVQLNGQPTALPDIQQHPVLSGYAQCLLAVRAAESKADLESFETRYPVEWREIWCIQPRTLLGHLALTRYPVSRRVENPAHSVVLMRQAELVVKYFDRRELDIEGFQWAGVFKAAIDVDDSFALAEPPAHDDWVPPAVDDKRRRREVNVALRRVKEAADQYLTPRASASAQGRDMAPSAVNVADMLADLLSGQEGSAPTRVVLPGAKSLGAAIVPTPDDLAPSGNPAFGKGHTATGPDSGVRRNEAGDPERRNAVRSRVNVTNVSREPARTRGWSRTSVQIQLSGTSSAGTVVEVAIRVGFEGGSMEDGALVRIVGWRDELGDTYNPRPQEFAPGATHEFVYESRSDLAIDIEAKLGAI